MIHPTPEQMVLQFHRTFGSHIETLPTLDVPAEVLALRESLIREEFEEYLEAIAAGNLVEVADALADLVYVLYGTAISYGIDLDRVIDEVHRSNMSKLDAGGHPIVREDGKMLKSALYSPPDVAGVLASQPSLTLATFAPSGLPSRDEIASEVHAMLVHRFAYDEVCLHGEFTGGPTDGEEYRMCEFVADLVTSLAQPKPAQPEGQLVKVCACGCNAPFDEVYESMEWASGWLSPDQARAQLRSKLVPESEVRRG